MKPGKLVISSGVFLAVTLPYWVVIPAAGYLLEVILAVILIWGAVENHLKVLIGACAIGLIVGALPGPAVLPFVLFFPLWLKAILPAIMLGLLIIRGWRAGNSFVLVAVAIAGFVMITYGQGVELFDQQIDLMGESIKSMITGTLTSQGYSSEVIVDTADKLAYMAGLLKRLLPGLLIMSGIGQLFVSFVAVEWYFTRRDSYFPGFGPFIYWKIPEKLLYFLGLVLIARLINDGVVKMAADNILFILSFFYAVCGLSLIEHLLRRLQLPMFMKIIFYFGLFLMQLPGLVAASIIGLFDSYFDFRKVKAHTLG
ncbi:MAG: DUF2232 domain-containing protein [FCB group bacterium]|nr:DUF2232 domain-containing protein [FCB group bacterium]